MRLGERRMKKNTFSFTVLSLICTLMISMILASCQNDVYSVIFKFNNGDNDRILYVEQNDIVQEPNNPFRYGYIFKGWFLGDDYYDFSNPITSNIELIAEWNVSIHTIMFKDYLGKTIMEADVPFGSSITSLIPNAPIVVGYDFAGWSAYIHETMPNEDLSVIANYVPYEGLIQTISFDQESIIKVASNGYSNAILTDNGNLIMWGRNQVPGMLCGPYDGSYDTLTPIDITQSFDLYEDEKIIDVYLGVDENIVITSQNRYFQWGGCYQCNLGLCPSDSLGYPKDITDQMIIPNEIIKHFEYWQGNMAVITESERIYTKGHINYGQFKEDISTIDQWFDQTDKFNLENDESIIEIHLGFMHSGARTSKGRLMMWGNNSLGALGAGSDIDKSQVPLDITHRFNLIQNEVIIQFEIGQFSTVVLTNIGRVFTFGSNRSGMLGTDLYEEVYIPLDVTDSFVFNEEERITKINLQGTQTIIVITNHSRAFGWGYNMDEQLSNNQEDLVYFPIDITSNFGYDQNTCLDFVIGLNHIIMVKIHEIVISGNRTFDLTA